jgi:hypothetical protein
MITPVRDLFQLLFLLHLPDTLFIQERRKKKERERERENEEKKI